MTRSSLLAAATILWAASAVPAVAQELGSVEPSGGASEGVIAFTVADFASARLNTALDMVNRLPGFTLETGDQVRGFAGAAGNVLIDSQRPTIKTDNLSDTLARIPIDQVERVELIRGGAAGVDMHGRTVVANVVRKRSDSFQQVVTATGDAFADTGRTLSGWNYQATRRSGGHQIDVQLGRGIQMDDSVGHGTRTTRDLVAGTTLLQNETTSGDGPVDSGRASYKGPLLGGLFSANGLVSTDHYTDASHYFSAATDEVYVSRSANQRGEIGLNFKRPLGQQLELEALALSKLAQGTGDSTGLDNGAASRVKIKAEAGETIGRSVLRYTPSSQLSFEAGGEAAFNFRKQAVALTEDGAAVALPASNVRVEELREEGFLQGTWRPSARLAFEAGVRVERSTITQTGDAQREREFVYPKPRLLATWSPTSTEQVRLRVERSVGQLDFKQFISSVNLATNVVSAGNAELQPDKTWAFELALEKRFWTSGAAVLTVRHEDISDVVDLVPFLAVVDAGDGSPPTQELVLGPGNIGDGKNDVVQLDLTVPFKRFGLDGGELKANALFQDSSVRDPLTHVARRISAQRPNKIQIAYRQDMSAQNLTWGVSWFAGWSERYYQLEEVQLFDLRNYWAAYLEYKPSPHLMLRAELNNADPYSFTIERQIFDGPRGTGRLASIETERRTSQVIGVIKARWTLG